MKDSPKISIIIPVYNAGNYLTKCLDSFVNQTLKHIEIILVLDCPTDGSDIIAEEYALKHDTIKLVRNKQNLNVGNSRNAGLEVATGEYVCFPDHDDYVMENMYEELYSVAAQYDADVVLSKEHNITPNDIIAPDYTDWKSLEVEKGDELTKSCFITILSNTHYLPISVVHTQIYRRELLMNHNIRFVDANYFAYEDNIFNLNVYKAVLEDKRVMCYLPKAYYCYVHHSSNTGGTIAYRKLEKCFTAVEYMNRYTYGNDFFHPEVLQAAYQYRCRRNVYSSFRFELRANKWKAFSRLKIIKEYPAVYSAFKQEKSNRFSDFKPMGATKRLFSWIVKVFY